MAKLDPSHSNGKKKKKLIYMLHLNFFIYYINTYYIHVLLKRLDYTKSKSEMKKRLINSD